jgi:hypothetical protein
MCSSEGVIRMIGPTRVCQYPHQTNKMGPTISLVELLDMLRKPAMLQDIPVELIPIANGCKLGAWEL